MSKGFIMNTFNRDLAGHIIAYVADTKSSNKNIQAEIDTLALEPALKFVSDIYINGSSDIKTDAPFDKTVDASILEVLATILDKAPTEDTRNLAVSDFIKRVNRTFKKAGDTLALKLAKEGTDSGMVQYPCVGRSVRENTPVTKWSLKDLEFTAKKDKEGKVTGAATNAPKKATEEGTSPNSVQVQEPSNLAELVAAIQASATKLDLGLDVVAECLLAEASTDAITFTVKRTKVQAKKAS